MKNNWWKWLIAIMLLGAFGVYVSNQRDESKRHRKEREAEYKSQDEADKKRFSEWVYIAKEKQIAPGETVRLLVIPSPLGDFLDTKCLIYTNQDFKQSTFICPDAAKENIAQGIDSVEGVNY